MADDAPQILNITNRLEGKFGKGVKLKSFLDELGKKYNSTTKTFNFANNVSITEKNINDILNTLNNPASGEEKIKKVLDALDNIDIGGGKKLSDEFKGITSGKTKKPQVTKPEPKVTTPKPGKIKSYEELESLFATMTQEKKAEWITKNEDLFVDIVKTPENSIKILKLSNPSFTQLRDLMDLYPKIERKISFEDFLKERGYKMPNILLRIPVDIINNLPRSRKDIVMLTLLGLVLAGAASVGILIYYGRKLYKKYAANTEEIKGEIEEFLSDGESKFINGNFIKSLNPDILNQSFVITKTISTDIANITFKEGLFIDEQKKKKYKNFKWESGTFTDTLKPLDEGEDVPTETEPTELSQQEIDKEVSDFKEFINNAYKDIPKSLKYSFDPKNKVYKGVDSTTTDTTPDFIRDSEGKFIIKK
jgi:hypothetical protein